jgi:hypothetical protein
MTADLGRIAQILFKFNGSDLTGTLPRMESVVRGVTEADFPDFLLARRRAYSHRQHWAEQRLRSSSPSRTLDRMSSRQP